MRNKNKLPLRNVLPKANDFSGLLGKGVSESEIILAGELFKWQMAEKRKRSAEAQSKTEAEAYRGYGGYGFGYVGYRGGYGGYRGGYGGYRGDTGDSVTEVVIRPGSQARRQKTPFTK